MALRVDTANKRPGEPPIRPKHIVSPPRLKGARLGRGRGGPLHLKGKLGARGPHWCRESGPAADGRNSQGPR